MTRFYSEYEIKKIDKKLNEDIILNNDKNKEELKDALDQDNHRSNVVYQEQITAICREIGGLSWPDSLDGRFALSYAHGTHVRPRRKQMAGAVLQKRNQPSFHLGFKHHRECSQMDLFRVGGSDRYQRQECK